MAPELGLLVALMIESAGRARCDQSVLPRPDRKMRYRRLVRDPRQRRIVYRMLGYPLVQPPDVVLFGIARKRRSKRNHRLHAIGVVARIFASEEPAEAPAHDH